MECPIVTKELADRIEKHETDAHLSRMEGMKSLPGNPLAVDIRRFGGATGFIVHGAPYLEVTRIVDLGPEDVDQVGPIAAWLHSHSVTAQIDISPHLYSEDLLRKLAESGFFQARFLSVMYGMPPKEPLPLPVGVTVREFSQAELDEFAGLVTDVQQIAALDQPLWREVYKSQVKDWRCYIAYVGGRPAGHAIMRIHGGVAALMFAATKPEFRGYGAQTALLRQRVADAGAAGCDLVTSASYPGTVSQRNQERAGLRVAYTKGLWMPLHRE